MIRELLKTIRVKYNQIVRFIRMNNERSLKFEYREFMKLREIVKKQFVSYTSSQNDKIERFEKVLMNRIKIMRIETNLSINMLSKMFKSVDYLMLDKWSKIVMMNRWWIEKFSSRKKSYLILLNKDVFRKD